VRDRHRCGFGTARGNQGCEFSETATSRIATRVCQYGGATPVVHCTTTGANAKAWPTVKSQRKKEVRGGGG